MYTLADFHFSLRDAPELDTYLASKAGQQITANVTPDAEWVIEVDGYSAILAAADGADGLEPFAITAELQVSA